MTFAIRSERASVRWPKRPLGWIPAIGPTDDGLIEVATFVVRTLLSRRFIFLRIIALRATLAATLAEKSFPCMRCCAVAVTLAWEPSERRGGAIIAGAGVVRRTTGRPSDNHFFIAAAAKIKSHRGKNLRLFFSDIAYAIYLSK